MSAAAHSPTGLWHPLPAHSTASHSLLTLSHNTSDFLFFEKKLGRRIFIYNYPSFGPHRQQAWDARGDACQCMAVLWDVWQCHQCRGGTWG